MKSIPLGTLIVAALVGGLVATVMTYLMVASSDDQEPVAEPRLAVTTPVPVAIQDQLQALRDQNRELLARVTALERRPEPIRTDPLPAKDAVTREDFAALAEKVARWMPVPNQDLSPESSEVVDPEAIEPSPAFAATVEKTLQTIRRRESARGWRQGVRKAQENLDDRLARMSEDLSLTNFQVDDLRTAFAANHERQLELIRLWEEGDTSDERLGEVKLSNHEQHQQSLANILTPEQLQQHQAAQGRGGK